MNPCLQLLCCESRSELSCLQLPDAGFVLNEIEYFRYSELGPWPGPAKSGAQGPGTGHGQEQGRRAGCGQEQDLGCSWEPRLELQPGAWLECGWGQHGYFLSTPMGAGSGSAVSPGRFLCAP